jgi:uracil-DNA glycosylase
MKKCIFIGQAMPRSKKDPNDWPSLNSWLLAIGIEDEQIREYFLYSALIDYFPGAKNGSHNVPTKKEIEGQRKRLQKTMEDFSPNLVVPVGRLSILYCLKEPFEKLNAVVGKIYTKDPYGLMGRKLTIVPLPHPSGASVWCQKPENKTLLKKALELLKQNLT